MAKHTLYECDRCHEESRSNKDWKTIQLPTGKDGAMQNWFVCPPCAKAYFDLCKEHEGQKRAFVAGQSLSPEHDANRLPFPQEIYEEMARAQRQQGFIYPDPNPLTRPYGKW